MGYVLYFEFAPSCQTSLFYSIICTLQKQCYSNKTCCVSVMSLCLKHTYNKLFWIPGLGLISLCPSAAPNPGLCIQWIIHLKIYLLILALALLLYDLSHRHQNSHSGVFTLQCTLALSPCKILPLNCLVMAHVVSRECSQILITLLTQVALIQEPSSSIPKVMRLRSYSVYASVTVEGITYGHLIDLGLGETIAAWWNSLRTGVRGQWGP